MIHYICVQCQKLPILIICSPLCMLSSIQVFLQSCSSTSWSGATIPGLTFSKPMPPPHLHVSVAPVEDHSHPH